MSTQEKSFVSAVIYSRDTEKTTIDALKAIYNFLQESFESFEIIFVNDSGTDKANKLIEIEKDFFKGKVTILNTAWRHGAELSMLAGTSLAIGDFIYEIESTNLEFPTNLLKEAYDVCSGGYDIVFVSPKTNLRFFSRLFYKLFNRFSYQNLSLETESFKIITRRALNATLKSKEKSRYRKIIYKSSGFPNTTIHFKPIKPIKSNRTLGENVSFAFQALLAFSDIGLKFTFWMSILFFLGSVFIGIYALSIYLTETSVALGWTTTMLFLSFSFSGVFLILTILGKYLTMILEESKKTPPYVIQSIKRLR